MIRPPKRAVTRFFIPLIDVLILLFCIFLLMPFVEKGASSGRLTAGEAESLRQRLKELEELLAQRQEVAGSPAEVQNLKDQIQELEAQNRNPVEQVEIRQLALDRDNLKVYRSHSVLGNPPRRVEMTEETAAEIVREDSLKLGKKKLVYVVFYPPNRRPPDGWVEKVEVWVAPARIILQEEVARGGS